MIHPNHYTIDFETTDKDASKAHAVEVALYTEDDDGQNPEEYHSLIKPPCNIPPETSAIHHLTDIDVAGAPPWGEIQDWLRSQICNKPTLLIAHNADYEKGILKNTLADLPVEWICTYKVALRIWPDAPAHKNEVLRYWLGLPGLGRRHMQEPHSATHDAKVTYQIFRRALQEATLAEMVAWSKEYKAYPKISFGKHAGLKWPEIPKDYLQWICRTPDMEVDVIACAKAELNRRLRGG